MELKKKRTLVNLEPPPPLPYNLESPTPSISYKCIYYNL